jgi:Xaa-Pro aminopeptidase
MLTREGCETRRARLWESVPEPLTWLLIADPRHVQYLCNFWVQPFSFSVGERGLLLLERGGDATLMADNFALRSAAHAPYVDREVVFPWYDHRHSVINRDHALLQALREAAGSLPEGTGLVEAEWLSLAATEVLDPERYTYSVGDSEKDEDDPPLDLGTILRQLRRQKGPDEVALLRQCMQAGDAGQARLLEIIREGISEFDVYREVHAAVLEATGRPALVYGDFRACYAEEPKNGGLPPGQGRTLQRGDLFVLDFSVVLDGYRSDFTNTVSVGEPAAEVRKLFSLCEQGLAAGERALRPGARAAEVHRAVASPFIDAGQGDVFPHHAGHGIGLGHPEPPILVPESTDVLLAGDVVTLEPGAYVKGVGGMRIEHNYLITNDGYERLSNHEIRLQ